MAERISLALLWQFALYAAPSCKFETETHGNHKEDQGKDFSSCNSSNAHAVVVRYRSKRSDCHDGEFVANLIDFRESIGGHK